MTDALTTIIDAETGEILDVRPFEMTSTGLVIRGLPTLDQWVEYGQVLVDASSALQWAIGDWINYGESRHDWGEKYTQALSAFQYKYEYLRNIAWVARSFDVSRRRDTLTFSHHQEVAPLDQPTQDKLLDKAEQEGLTRDQLRDEKRRETGQGTHGDELDRFSGNFNQAVRWLADMKFKHGWSKRIRIVIYEE